MREMVNFEIRVSCGFSDIQSELCSLIADYRFDPIFGEENTAKRIKDWLNAIVFVPGEKDSGRIVNASESPMYLLDYTTLFPDLFYDIVDAFPESVFSAHSEYANDDYGVMEENNFTYPTTTNEKELIMEETYSKNDLTEIIRKILLPLTQDELTQVCEDLGVAADADNLPADIYEAAADAYDDSVDGIMEYIHCDLINAVIGTAGIIIYDTDWNGHRD